MGTLPRATMLPGESPTSAPKLQPFHGRRSTRRVAMLEATVERLRALLQEAEEDLQHEKARCPEIGDFVRCPLTDFYGQVTKIIPRPGGRPWIEILPYLGRDMPGHAPMDLYENWELIDPPSDEDDMP